MLGFDSQVAQTSGAWGADRSTLIAEDLEQHSFRTREPGNLGAESSPHAVLRRIPLSTRLDELWPQARVEEMLEEADVTQPEKAFVC